MKTINFIIAAAILLSGNVTSQTDSPNPPELITLSIATVTLDLQKLIDTIDINIAASAYPLAGADLKIGFNSYAIDILEILPGEILDSCGWEFFEVKASIDQGKEYYPRSFWTILAMSDFMPDSVRADCYGLGRPASIARLVISIDSSKISSDTLFPIYFFWEDCTDNTLTNVSGDSLFMSLIVDGVSSITAINDDSALAIPPGTTPAGALTLPSRFGAPDFCINPRAQNKPVRKLVFQSGGIHFQTVVENK